MAALGRPPNEARENIRQLYNTEYTEGPPSAAYETEKISIRLTDLKGSLRPPTNCIKKETEHDSIQLNILKGGPPPATTCSKA